MKGDISMYDKDIQPTLKFEEASKIAQSILNDKDIIAFIEEEWGTINWANQSDFSPDFTGSKVESRTVERSGTWSTNGVKYFLPKITGAEKLWKAFHGDKFWITHFILEYFKIEVDEDYRVINSHDYASFGKYEPAVKFGFNLLMGQFLPGFSIVTKGLEIKEEWDKDKHVKNHLVRKNIIDSK